MCTIMLGTCTQKTTVFQCDRPCKYMADTALHYMCRPAFNLVVEQLRLSVQPSERSVVATRRKECTFSLLVLIVASPD